MGTHLRTLSENYPMNTSMTGFRWFSKIFASSFWDESSLSIGRIYGILNSFNMDVFILMKLIILFDYN